MTTAPTLREQVDHLTRQVEALAAATPEAQAAAAASAARARLVAQAEAGHAKAVQTAEAFAPRLAAWRTRGEAAIARLPHAGNSPEAMAFARQMPAAEATCRALPDRWAAIRASLDAPEAPAHLPALAAAIRGADLETGTVPRLRDGVRQLVADLEHIVTLTEA